MPRRHAVVMGGSIAGLLAARVLYDYYEEVTIVERDDLPSEATHRRGIPHSRHTHGLLAGGREALEHLFPLPLPRVRRRSRQFQSGVRPGNVGGSAGGGLELQALLGANPANLAMRFFERASKLVDTPWSIAVGSDLRMTEAVGPRPASWRFTNWYMSRLHRAAHTDPVCALAFHRVGNLLAAPASILQPGIAFRVLRSGLIGRLRGLGLGDPHAAGGHASRTQSV